MELRNSSGLAGTLILQVEASHQVVIAPYMLAYQVHLEHLIFIFVDNDKQTITYNQHSITNIIYRLLIPIINFRMLQFNLSVTICIVLESWVSQVLILNLTFNFRIANQTIPEVQSYTSYISVIYLIDMIQFRSLLRPVAVAKLLSVLGEAREHDHDDAALLPHHLPEVGGRVRHGSSCRDVCRVAGVMVGLMNKISKIQN